MPKFTSYAPCRSSMCRPHFNIPLPVLLACVVAFLLAVTSFSAFAGGYQIGVIGVNNQYALPPGSSATQLVSISGPGTAAIRSAVLTLNGMRVTVPFGPTPTVGTIMGRVPGFQPGDNLLQLYASAQDTVPAAQLRTSILLTPTISCTSMNNTVIDPSQIALPTGGAIITNASVTAATTNAAIASTAPEFCTLTGVIYPFNSGGIDINFKVAIPTQWNQKSWQFGGGGTDGSVPGLISPSNSAMLPTNVLRPIALQYATYGGDSGHSSGNAWIDNPNFPVLSESFQNFCFDSLKKTHDAAVAVMKAMYGKAPAVNYFAGQSQGGREALTVLWRYPQDYDGIMAQDFLAYFANLNFNPQLQGSLQVNDPANGYYGTWVPGGGTLSKVTTLKNYVLSKCDGLDNLVDGVIQDYKGCAALFDPILNPTVLQDLSCGGGSETASCLTADEIATLTGPAFLGPVQYNYPLRDNEYSYPGWGPFEGLSLLTSSAPTLATGTSYTGAGIGGLLGIALVREYFCGNQDNCNVLQVFHNLDAQQQKIQVLSTAVDIDEDWSQFRARGGKVIMDTSAADTISNPLAQFKLDDQVVQKMGQAAFDSFARHYVSPMTGHGGGGNGATVPTAADLLNPMIAWVERLVTPPDAPTQMRITTSGSGSNTQYNVVQSRPLCRYPMYPRYNGSGDTSQASSYTCATP
jgi:Tannase and feruloyl esterase